MAPILVQDLLDPLNRLPNYFLSATVTSLADLGGDATAPLPAYGQMTWREWNVSNGQLSSFRKFLVRNPLLASLLLTVGILGLMFGFLYWFYKACYHEGR